MPIITLTATIGAGQPISNLVDCADNFVVGIITPPAWTVAPVSILVSPDSTNFFDLFEFHGSSSTPSELAFNIRPGVIIAINPDTLLMARYLRLRSGTRDEPVAQAENRIFSILTINRVTAA